MKRKLLAAILALAAPGIYAQSPALGINFAASDPDAATSSLLPEEIAGAVPQANWNNLEGPAGDGVTGLSYDVNGAAAASSASVTWSSPNTWNSEVNNGFIDGPDRRLTFGYLDTGNTSESGISITVQNLDEVFTDGGYDVYVYFVSDSAENRGGAYTIDDGTGPRVQYGSTMAMPFEYVEDPGNDPDLSADGTHLRFIGLTGDSFTLTSDTTLTTPNGFRAPINAIQIVPATPFGPEFTTQPEDTRLYVGGTAVFTAEAQGFPAITSLRWQKDGADLSDGERISGAANSTLVITGVTAADAGNYTLVATSPRGSESSGPAALEIVPVSTADYAAELAAAGPLAHWRLNEAAGTAAAYDHEGGFHGDYSEFSYWGEGILGPSVPVFPGFESGNTSVDTGTFLGDAAVRVPTPELNTNSATFITWIYPTGAQLDYTGVFMTRSGTQAGIGYTTGNQLGYTWNDNSTWSWNSGLVPPDFAWTMVALVVEPEQATLYMGALGSLSAAINPIEHQSEAWGGTALIGNDAGGDNRVFMGQLDEAAVFNRALSFEEIAALYTAATGIPQTAPPAISPQPASVTRYAGQAITLEAGAAGSSLSYQWLKDGSELTGEGRISGTATPVLTIAEATAADEGEYTLRVENSYGETTSEPAAVTVLPVENGYVAEILEQDPLSYWRFNETSDPINGDAPVFDYWGGHTGTYGISAQNGFLGIAGPRPDDGYAAFEADNFALQPELNLADSWATVPGPGITTDTVTILAWINPETLVNNAGIVFARAGQPATGLNLNGFGNLGYHWLDTQASYSWDSGITPPLNEWSLAALVVEPEQASIYLINGSGIQSAMNTATNEARAFTDDIRIGGDPNNVNRAFNGRIDEVAIFDRALTSAELAAIYQSAAGGAAPVISAQPASLLVFPGVNVQITAGATGGEPLEFQWQKQGASGFVDIEDGGGISGAATPVLTITGVSQTDAGEYRLTVENPSGSAISDPATLSLRAVPPIPAEGTYGAAVLDSGAFAYWRLNETGDPFGGGLPAYDHAGMLHGVYGGAAFNGFHGVMGPRPSSGFALFEEENTALQPLLGTADSWVTVPAPGVTTDSVTITAWIQPYSLVGNAGIVFARAGQPATGFNLDGEGNLGYHWLDTPESYNWNSGIIPPLSQWSLAALVVGPDQAAVYLINESGVQSAVNTATHAPRAFTDSIRIGGDPSTADRTFDGIIDEVAIFPFAMTAEQVEALYNGEVIAGAPELAITREGGQVIITWEGPGTLQSTPALQGVDTVWTDEATEGNTLTVTPGGAARFYRVAQ